MTASSDNLPMSAAEINAADQAFELLSSMTTAQADRVLANVHTRLNQAKLEVPVEERPMYARGIGGPLGKLVCVVKTKIDETTFDLFLKYCSKHETDIATLLRDSVYLMVHGRTCEQMVMDRLKHVSQRTEALAKHIGPFGGPESNRGG